MGLSPGNKTPPHTCFIHNSPSIHVTRAHPSNPIKVVLNANITISSPMWQQQERVRQTNSQSYTGGQFGPPTTAQAPSTHTAHVETPSYDRSDPRFQGVQDNAVYMAVHGRCADNSFHCGMFVPIVKENNRGLGWYVNNAHGGWHIELRSPEDVIFHPSLMLLLTVGEVSREHVTRCMETLKSLGADGTLVSSSMAERGSPTRGKGKNVALTSADMQNHTDTRPVTAGPVETMASVKRALYTLHHHNLISLNAPLDELHEKAFRIATQVEGTFKAGYLKAMVI